MAIHTQQTLSQFIGSDPQPTFTSRSNPNFYARIGQERHGRKPGASFTELEPALAACRATQFVLDDVAACRRAEDAFHAGPAGNDERRD